ncbi:TRAP transporter substrate-binding protein DctP, partial [Aquimixticola soesokkakensis]|uniref:TRAP transporter substrate-binding protein DctP n=1 Tax=Aquimixticola soesokkakensis TaxID=1519096 RepID=UPI0013564FE9
MRIFAPTLPVIAAVMLTVFLGAPAAAEAEVTLRIASGTASNGNICNGHLDLWGETIKAASNGRIDYELYCDGTLAKMGDAVNRVEQGVADVAWDVPGFYGARFAGLNVIGLPGLYLDPEPASGAVWQAYQSGALGDYPQVKILWMQVASNYSFFMRDPVADYTALAGAKIGMGSQIRAAQIDRLGGVPIALKVPEFYQSLSKGAVDGLMTTPGAVFDFGIESLVREIYNAPFGGGLTFVVMNTDSYAALPDDLKAVIDAHSGFEASKAAAAYLRDEEARAVARLEGVTIRDATPEDLVA